MIDLSSLSLCELAGFVANEFKKNDIEAILVGGACVTIYSKNRYQSYDLDFVSYDDMKKIDVVLRKIGFEKKHKYYQHPDCPWFIEFVSPPIAIGDQPIHDFNILSTRLGEIKLLKPVDSVKDRLASFYYWNDKQALIQAIDICREQSIDISEVRAWSEKEEQLEKFKLFEEKYNRIF